MKKINMIIKKSINQDWLNKVVLTLNGFKFSDEKKLVKLELVVERDNYNYNDNSVTNKHEKLSVYAENIRPEQLASLTLDKKVKIEKISNVATYGEYGTNISITGSVQFYD